METTYSAVMDFSDLMQCLCVSERTVYRLIADKTIPAFKEERDWQFLRSDVIDYLDGQ